ncbi:hypothetical protein PROAA_3600001 [Candidatus Propionivibrio aalborgensis]|uniref:Uncharacterized protein n=1 Tax=Candidatus Propionivibrio aalborgensis TaxID=1860101 RepID=A0A1A8XZ88_9RHOO|nr:hypothetical protein PROAA_3600001 [Candidatus Propionivibrio aalborgensis]
MHAPTECLCINGKLIRSVPSPTIHCFSVETVRETEFEIRLWAQVVFIDTCATGKDTRSWLLLTRCQSSGATSQPDP